jgi:hypothetical protein
LEQELDKAKRKFAENQKSLDAIEHKLSKLELHEVGDDDDDDEDDPEAPPKAAEELKTLSDEEIDDLDPEGLKAQIVLLEGKTEVLVHLRDGYTDLACRNYRESKAESSGTEGVSSAREGVPGAGARSRKDHTSERRSQEAVRRYAEAEA